MLAGLELAEAIGDPLVRRRGLVHLVNSDPAEAILPSRHLAVLLLNGRGNQPRTGLAALTRKLTMLQDLRRRSIKQLVVVVAGAFSIPDELGEMWSDGYRTALTFVSSDPQAGEIVQSWRQQFSAPMVELIGLSPADFGNELQNEFLRGRDGSIVIRMRDDKGAFHKVDIGKLDDPERPVLGCYDLVGSDAVTPILPSDLSSAEVEGFFADTSASWRPYAAGMVWERDKSFWEKLRARLRTLDRKGTEENRILYLSVESGAGATTSLRDLAWRSAAEGYPTLVAQPGPLTISGHEMASFLTRLIETGRDLVVDSRVYEVPCVIVFDQSHWDGQLPELLSFARELERSGRRVCMIMATGPYVGLGIRSERRFDELGYLSHAMRSEDALALGRHLNRFLSPHGTARTDQEWRAFYQSSSVAAGEDHSAFWIVLSFWLQRHIDLGETVQARVYRQFREVIDDPVLREAVLRIAAFSTVRSPLPDALLPDNSKWPVAELLEDKRKALGALGLVRIHGEIDRYWAMAHDLIGRFLFAGLFFDHKARTMLGFDDAMNPEHLRFLILRKISALPCLEWASLRDMADAFAVSIFKIDPDHGHGTLAGFWREVLDALDAMPRSIRTTSRTFLHHCAISRRRIASDRNFFQMSDNERVDLLRRAVEDLNAALKLDSGSGGETDLNLFNSLALALHDQAEAEAAAGVEPEVIADTRAAAQEATRQAFALNPDNTFVVETYARTLISEGRAQPELAAEKALEVLTLAYGMMERDRSQSRHNALSRLAEKAFELLMEAGSLENANPDTETGAIAIALASLGAGQSHVDGMCLGDLPAENRIAAAELLAAEPLHGNVQAVKLRYMLLVLDCPLNFDLQLELLQSLFGSGPAFTPQMELELAVLMFQRDRSHEADRMFKRLRNLWHRGEHFVEVPPRLHWLMDASGVERRQVRGRVSTNADGRSFARVADFQEVEVPFRTAEFGQDRIRPGTAIAAYVSFGHNGPLLRPLTAQRR